MRADAHRRCEGLSPVARARKQYDGFIELPLDPSDVNVAGVGTVRPGIREHAWHILPLNVQFVTLESLHRGSIFVPGFAAIDRAAYENAVSTCAMCPVRRAAELVEVQRGEIKVTLVVECNRHISATAPALDRWKVGQSKCLTAVGGVCNGRRLKCNHHFVSVVGIYCDRGFVGANVGR